MDADQCQADLNTMSELESPMEKMVLSDTKEQEEPPATEDKPEQVAVNGHQKEEMSPVSDKPNDDFPNEVPESEPLPEEPAPMATLEPDVPRDVSENEQEAPSSPKKVFEVPEPDIQTAVSEMEEKPVGAEDMSEVVPAQPDGSPGRVSDAPDPDVLREASEKVEESMSAEKLSEAVLTQQQPEGSPIKVLQTPGEDMPQDSSEMVGVEELSDAVLTHCQPAGSPKTVSPPDAIKVGTESEKLQPLSVKSDPEPKVLEPVPEPVVQTSPEADKVEQLVEMAVHKEVMPAEIAVVAPIAEAAVEKVETIKSLKTVEECLPEVHMESPTVSESVKVCSEASIATEAAHKVQSAEVIDTKEPEAVKEEEPKKPAEPVLTVAMDQVQQEANVERMELTKEEVVTVTAPPPPPAAGSLAFALLEHEQTKAALRSSRTLVVLRGLPGSGKSFLARAIADSYQNICSVVSADAQDPASADSCKALDDAVISCCGAATGPSVVVVDDTNHTHDRLARLAEIAEQNSRVVLFLEPRTEWCQDLPELVKRTSRGLDEAQIQVMKAAHDQARIPLFYAWFLLHQDKIKCTAMDFLKTLDSLEAFKKHLADFPVETEKEVDLEQYFKCKWSLHCTTKFCDHGKANGAKEYAEQAVVREMNGSLFELSLTALFVTPRTVGARVALSEAQMALWPADAEKESEALVPGAGALPPGSRAHISLGCADKVAPVQTGLDLLDILVLQQSGQEGELVEEMELGSLVYLEKGRWLLTLREPISVQACFSNHYQPKEADETQKEPERKKKIKCSIL